MEVLSLAGTVFIGYNLIRFILYISKVTYYFHISPLPPPLDFPANRAFGREGDGRRRHEGGKKDERSRNEGRKEGRRRDEGVRIREGRRRDEGVRIKQEKEEL